MLSFFTIFWAMKRWFEVEFLTQLDRQKMPVLKTFEERP